MPFSELIPALQMAIGPVILISGVGLLLLSMTNRFGRVIDRTRVIAERSRQGDGARYRKQLEMLCRRASLLRAAISLASVSILLAALLIMALFISAAMHADDGRAVAALFCACMVTLITSLIVFLQDLNLSLAAMNLDITQGRESDGESSD